MLAMTVVGFQAINQHICCHHLTSTIPPPLRLVPMKLNASVNAFAIGACLLMALSVYPVRTLAAIITPASEEALTEGQVDKTGHSDTMNSSDENSIGKWIYSAEGWKYLIGGEEARGVQIIDSTPYYFSPTSHIMTTGWIKDELNDCWYYANQSGVLCTTNWLCYANQWYWFDDCSRMTIGFTEVGGTKYHFAASGAMSTGWIPIDGNWYYAAPAGHLSKGWECIDTTWYYFDPETCVMQTGRIELNDGVYELGSSGAMAIGWILKDNGWLYADASGRLASGWKQVGAAWYYMHPDTLIMQTGRLIIDGIPYYLENSGVMKTGWLFDSELKNWYYAKPSGTYAAGWTQIDNLWYYMNTENYRMLTGWFADGPKTYFLNDSGAMSTGWIHFNDNWYHADGSGVIAKSCWRQIDGCWYWFDKYGAMATGLITINQTKFYMGENGAMKTGWVLCDGEWLYFLSDGSMAANTWVDVYYLLSDGTMAQSQWIGQYYVGSDGKWIPGYSEVTPKAS